MAERGPVEIGPNTGTATVPFTVPCMGCGVPFAFGQAHVCARAPQHHPTRIGGTQRY
jgi:hypothetical protein